MKLFSLKKLTDNNKLNLFNVTYRNKKSSIVSWFYASRKNDPQKEIEKEDAVIIVPIQFSSTGNYLIMVKEYRIAIRDYVYSCPAGIIDSGDSVDETVTRELKEETGFDVDRIIKKSPLLFSCPGLTDESYRLVFVSVSGQASVENQEKDEDIEVLLCDIIDIKKFVNEKCKVDGRIWPILYHFSVLGKIEIK